MATPITTYPRKKTVLMLTLNPDSHLCQVLSTLDFVSHWGTRSPAQQFTHIAELAAWDVLVADLRDAGIGRQFTANETEVFKQYLAAGGSILMTHDAIDYPEAFARANPISLFGLQLSTGLLGEVANSAQVVATHPVLTSYYDLSLWLNRRIPVSHTHCSNSTTITGDPLVTKVIQLATPNRGFEYLTMCDRDGNRTAMWYAGHTPTLTYCERQLFINLLAYLGRYSGGYTGISWSLNRLPLVCPPENVPVVIALDTTNGFPTKPSGVIFEAIKSDAAWRTQVTGTVALKPMFSLCAVGDATFGDATPLQASSFVTLDALSKDWIDKLVIEQKGGPYGKDSYELGAALYAYRSQVSRKGPLFFLGDELYYPAAVKAQVDRLMGAIAPADIPTPEVFTKLQQLYDVYYLYTVPSIIVQLELQEALKNNGAQTGEVTVSLGWRNRNDLDLQVTSPAGNQLGWRQKATPCGGVLDIDMNASSLTTSETPVENAYWVTAPRGVYTVVVNNFTNRAVVPTTPFTLLFRFGGREQQIIDSLGDAGTSKTYTFEYTGPIPPVVVPEGQPTLELWRATLSGWNALLPGRVIKLDAAEDAKRVLAEIVNRSLV